MTPASTAAKTRIEYDDGPVRQFMIASIFWGIVRMLVGVLVATQLGVWQANFNTSWLTFGRLRPLHTNAVIFAFVGNMMFAGVYHSTQRLVKARLPSDVLAKVHFWGWQLIIVAAAITLPLGYTQGKEYAELEWPIDLAITIIWLVFAFNFFWTLKRRAEKHLYVAVWFYIATIVTVLPSQQPSVRSVKNQLRNPQRVQRKVMSRVKSIISRVCQPTNFGIGSFSMSRAHCSTIRSFSRDSRIWPISLSSVSENRSW